MTRGAMVWTLRSLTVVILLAAWVYGAGPGGVADFILPAPTDVLQRLLDMIRAGELWSHAARTLLEIVIAGAIALVSGLLVGFLTARSRFWAEVVEPLLAWGYIAPLILFYPIFILWFGVGMWSKVVIAAAAAFFPIAYNALRGFRMVDPRYVRVGVAFKATPGQIDREIKLNAAKPLIITGVRIALATVFIIVIVAEMLASEMGLGYLISRTSQTFDTTGAFSSIVVVLIAVVLFQVLIRVTLRSRETPSGRVAGKRGDPIRFRRR